MPTSFTVKFSTTTTITTTTMTTTTWKHSGIRNKRYFEPDTCLGMSPMANSTRRMGKCYVSYDRYDEDAVTVRRLCLRKLYHGVCRWIYQENCDSTTGTCRTSNGVSCFATGVLLVFQLYQVLKRFCNVGRLNRWLSAGWSGWYQIRGCTCILLDTCNWSTDRTRVE